MSELLCLVVEDSPITRQLLAHALSRIANVDVIETADGVAGLKELAARKFDLVITDLDTPLMGGLKLVKKIRSDATHQDVPIILLVGKNTREGRSRSLAMGATVYLTKPVQAPQLIAKVKELLKI